MRLPGQLIGLAAEHGQAFGKIAGHGHLSQDHTIGKVDFAQARLAYQAGALDYFPIEEDQALGKGVSIVWESVHDLVSILPDLPFGRMSQTNRTGCLRLLGKGSGGGRMLIATCAH